MAKYEITNPISSFIKIFIFSIIVIFVLQFINTKPVNYYFLPVSFWQSKGGPNLTNGSFVTFLFQLLPLNRIMVLCLLGIWVYFFFFIRKQKVEGIKLIQGLSILFGSFLAQYFLADFYKVSIIDKATYKADQMWLVFLWCSIAIASVIIALWLISKEWRGYHILFSETNRVVTNIIDQKETSMRECHECHIHNPSNVSTCLYCDTKFNVGE